MHTIDMDLFVPPKWLVFAGGGMRGVAYVGALDVLKKRGSLGSIRGVAGVSIGSLIAFLYAIGYDIDEMRQIAFDIDFNTLQHVDEDTVFSVLENYGIDDGAGIRAFLGNLLVSRGFKPSATFADLKSTGKIALRVYACRIRDGATVEFSSRTSPSTSIVDALCASMAVPLYFVPVCIGDDIYVDGGTTNNYPIDCFSLAEQHVSLGFVFKKDVSGGYNVIHNDFLNYGKQLIKIMGIDRYKSQLKRFEHQTVVIDCGSMDLLDFTMNRESKEDLMYIGTKAMHSFLEKKRSHPTRRYSIG